MVASTGEKIKVELCGAEKREVSKPWGSGYIVWYCNKPKGHKSKEHVAAKGKVRWL